MIDWINGYVWPRRGNEAWIKMMGLKTVRNCPQGRLWKLVIYIKMGSRTFDACLEVNQRMTQS
jgi:hypothetical protein